ncbi:MAG: hypothetical protein L3J26_02130 [Candidatus Polarisedimenticolaceae bacterium]|nr:hypothetical protein [Candidatus Polarisedimenticolaceae bacterium]
MPGKRALWVLPKCIGVQNQQHAVAVVQNQLTELLTPREDGQEMEVDEEWLGRILRGEIPADTENRVAHSPGAESTGSDTPNETVVLTRRDLLRGRIHQKS